MSNAKVSDNKKYWQFLWRFLGDPGQLELRTSDEHGFFVRHRSHSGTALPGRKRSRTAGSQKKKPMSGTWPSITAPPQTSAFALGLAASMEEQYAADPRKLQPGYHQCGENLADGPLVRHRRQLLPGHRPDHRLRLGHPAAQQGSILGPILAMLISFVPSFVVTWFCGKIGYTTGSKYLTNLQGGMMDKMMYVCGIVGLMVIGAMVASMVGLTTPIAFESTGPGPSGHH